MSSVEEKKCDTIPNELLDIETMKTNLVKEINKTFEENKSDIQKRLDEITCLVMKRQKAMVDAVKSVSNTDLKESLKSFINSNSIDTLVKDGFFTHTSKAWIVG